MVMAEGGFSASLDADSEGEEGKFYVWSYDEIMDTLGLDDGRFFATHYDVTVTGNFEGRNILNRLKTPAGNDADEARLAAMRAKLLTRRAGRIRPGLDDKVLADWNGLMIAALAQANIIFDEPSWLALATRAFDFVVGRMTRDENRLGHAWRAGQLKFPGLASDHACMIRAALALHETTGRSAYVEQALAWQEGLDRFYAKADGSYYLTAADADDLIIRPDSTADEATPNHNAVAAQNLIRLSVLTGDDRWRDQADRLIAAIAPVAAQNLYMHMALMNAIDLRLRAAEIVVIGTGEGAERLLAAARRIPALDRIVVAAKSAGALGEAHPAAARAEATNAPCAFLCVAETCSLPVSDAEGLRAALAAVRQP
jgi:uncharacterized protein YyaL (SSP411 family)